jgi:hypothetical protein
LRCDLNGKPARAVERVTAYDDLLASILQARLTQVTVDQNNDMRKIAAWAARATTGVTRRSPGGVGADDPGKPD